MKTLSLLLPLFSFVVLAQEPILKANTFRPVFNHPEKIKSSDLNGDGLLDLVVSGYNYNGIQIYINQGGLTFQRLKNLSFDKRVTGFATADFDGDGDQDIWLANHFYSEYEPYDTLLSNDGTGNFTRKDIMIPVYYSEGQSDYEAEFMVNDWNDDGQIDFLKIDRSGPRFVNAVMFTNDGQGGFDTKITDFNFDINTSSLSVGKQTTMADFDQDGDMDLWSVHGRHLTVFINKGQGVFSSDSISDTNVTVDDYNNVIFEDINQDGHIDVQFFSQNKHLFRFINLGNGEFSESSYEYALGDEESSFSNAGFIDANGDGVLDLWLVDDYELQSQLLLSNVEGSLDVTVNLQSLDEQGKRLVLRGDLNSDGNDDVVTVGKAGMNVWQTRSSSGFQKIKQPEVDQEMISANKAVLFDMNGDSKLDSVLNGSNGIFVALANSKTGFGDYFLWSETTLLNAQVVDFNSDGFGDVLGVNSNGKVSLFTNTGSSLTEQVIFQSNEDVWNTVKTGDIDSDGNFEILVFCQSFCLFSDANVIILRQTEGMFHASTLLVDDEVVDVEDLDGDGQVELITYKDSNGPGTIVVYEFTVSGVTKMAEYSIYKDWYTTLIKPFFGGVQKQILVKKHGDTFGLLAYDGSEMTMVKEFKLPRIEFDLGSFNPTYPRESAQVNGDADWDFYDGNYMILSEEGLYRRLKIGVTSQYQNGPPAFGDIDGDTDQDLVIYDSLKGITTLINTTIDQDFSGLWFNPTQNGHGLQVEEVISNGIPQVNLAWYVYHNGQPMWVTGVGPIDGDSATIPLAITSGASFGSAFNSSDVELAPWGNMTLTFTDKHKLNLAWDGSDYGFSQGQMPLERLSVLSGKLKSQTGIKTCHTGSWFNPNENGHGFLVQVIAGEVDRMILTWFTYHNGEQYWMIADGNIEGDTAVMNAYAASGPDFPPDYNTSDYAPELWGQITFKIKDDENALVSWQPELPGFEAGSLTVNKLTYIDRYRCH